MTEEASVVRGVPSFDKLQIVKEGRVTLTKPASDSFESVTEPHGLDFVPIMICFAEYDSGGGVTTYIPVPLHTTTPSGTNLVVSRAIEAQVDSYGVSLYIATGTSGSFFDASYTVTFKYYLLRSIAN